MKVIFYKRDIHPHTFSPGRRVFSSQIFFKLAMKAKRRGGGYLSRLFYLADNILFQRLIINYKNTKLSVIGLLQVSKFTMQN